VSRTTFGLFYTLNFVCDITLTLQEVYLPVSKTCSGSITRFNTIWKVRIKMFLSSSSIRRLWRAIMYSPRGCQRRCRILVILYFQNYERDWVETMTHLFSVIISHDGHRSVTFLQSYDPLLRKV
jgi:hypothetical protein